MKRWLLVMVLALSAVGGAQTSFWTDRAVGVSPFQNIQALVPIQYGQVRVCTFSASPATPCVAADGQVFDINGNSLTVQGGNFGQVTTDVVGRFSFGCVSGLSYTIQVAATGSNTPQLSYPITCNGNLNG